MAQTAKDPFGERRTRESVGETLGLGVVATILAAVYGMLVGGGSHSSDWGSRLLDWMTVAGPSALNAINDGFVIVIPTLLGFYGLVAGGQLVVSPERSRRLRRGLGVVAQLIMAAILPALTLSCIAGATHPDQSGTLLVAVPAALLSFGLTVRLGRFIVFDPQVRRAAAVITRDWARDHGRRKLRRRSRRPIALVFAVNIGVAAFAATFVDVASIPVFALHLRSLGSVLLLFLLYAAIAAFSALSGVALPVFARGDNDRLVVVFFGLFFGVTELGMLVLASGLITSEKPSAVPGGVSVLVAAGLIAISIFWPRRVSWWVLRDWTLQRAAARISARMVAAALRTSVHEIREIDDAKRALEGLDHRSLRTRAVRALRILLGESEPSRSND